jgi:mannosyltransferase OCH1-like enzyme
MIPKVVHRIWLRSPVPSHLELHWATWRSVFPDYTLQTWTESELRHLDLPQCFRAARTYAERADIARVSILNAVGGIYADCDVSVLRRFDHLWTDSDRMVFFEERAHVICNGIMAAAPGSLGLMVQLIRRNAMRTSPDAAPNVRTGPYAVTAAVDYLRSIDPRGIRIYPPAFLALPDGDPMAVARTEFRDPPSWTQAVDVEDLDRWGPRDRLLDLRLLPLRLRRRVRQR